MEVTDGVNAGQITTRKDQENKECYRKYLWEVSEFLGAVARTYRFTSLNSVKMIS